MTALAPLRAGASRPKSARLPAWPLAWLLVGYPLWWVLGLGEVSWALAGLVMAALLLRSSSVIVPRGFGLMVGFLVWVGLSAVMLDSFGRLLGFSFRYAGYIGVAVIFVYVYNARAQLPLDRVLGYLTAFWVWVVTFGYLALAFPNAVLVTPLARILPSGLASNDFVREMVVRRLTQYNPDAWFTVEPRPSAPFLYTNNWGNAYSLLVPLVLLYILRLGPGLKRRLLVLAVPLSAVPAFLTLNRGMFVGLGIVTAVVIVRLLLQGRVAAALGPMAVAAVGAVLVVVLPVAERLSSRLEVSGTNEDRLATYLETVTRTAQSPFLGYGYPRPPEVSGYNPVGTQGQVWMVLFSHGFIGLALFLAVLGWMLVRALRAQSTVAVVISGVLAALAVEVFYYGVNGVGLAVGFIAAALVMRDRDLSIADSGGDARAWGMRGAAARR